MAKKPEPAPPVDHTPKPPRQIQEAMAAADAIRAEMVAPEAPALTETLPQETSEEPSQPETPSPAGEEPTWEQRARSLQGR